MMCHEKVSTVGEIQIGFLIFLTEIIMQLQNCSTIYCLHQKEVIFKALNENTPATYQV